MDYPSEFNDFKKMVQDALDSTTPWIGMCITAASAVCTLAMAADAVIGFRSKKYWLPCKYFFLNAFSLTVLAVAMKLPVDLTSIDLYKSDKLARVSSLFLMSCSMSNFMTSLGSIENNEIILNMAALGILVITIAGNVCIHNFQMRYFLVVEFVLAAQISSLVTMLLLFVMLCSLAIMVPSAKRYIELKYDEMHKSLSNRVKLEWGRRCGIDEVGVLVKGYWMMAETGSPQFVVARSAISSTSGLLCLFGALILAQSLLRDYQVPSRERDFITKLYISDYSWSVDWILYAQCIGVVVGSIAPLSRWFIASWFEISEMQRRSFRDELKIHKYWTLRLVEWRNRSLPFQVQNRLCKKLLRDAIRFLLNVCIGVQILFVFSGKLILFLCARSVNAFVLCFCKNSKRPDSNDKGGGSESKDGAEVDFSQYVILLEGEPQLPHKILNNIWDEADKLIQIGEKKQPKNLIRLLEKSANFNGVGRFDSNRVPRLHTDEPPNCWSLPVVTLTTISIAVTSIADEKANQLLASVGEGLSTVKLIEKTLDRNRELESIRKAAEVVWDEVEVDRKWHGKDLKSASVRGKTHEETLQNLSNEARKIVTDFRAQTRDNLMQNPLNWPVKVIAANSMYRIAQTILLRMQDGEQQADHQDLFESISIAISDIIAACLTNLVQVIKLKCHRCDIKERQESVRRAAILLGESKEILEILQLQQHELPSLGMEKAANIDEWRASMAHDVENPSTSVSASK